MTKTADDKSYEYDGMFNKADYERFAFVQDVTWQHVEQAGILDSSILLDSQSTVDVFMKKNLLNNIHDVKKTLSFHCNTGVTTLSKMGYLPGYGTVCFYEYGIANILSLNNVKKKYHMTYVGTACDCFEVHKVDGTKCVFKPSKNGLF